MNKKKVCVFASSSNFLEEIYYEEVSELGCLLGKSNFDVVYGGSNLGLMWCCVKAAKLEGAKVYGVMPEKLFNILGSDSTDVCDELHVSENMRTRKAKLDEISDAVVAVPGGFGTLEELSEMIVQKQLGYTPMEYRSSHEISVLRDRKEEDVINTQTFCSTEDSLEILKIAEERYGR